MVKIHLLEENIKEIYLQNRTMSAVGNVSIVIVSALGFMLLYYAILGDAVAGDMGISFSKGPLFYAL